MNTLLFSFRVGGYLFGAPASSVVELSREVEVFRVPGSPPFVKGLINLRGQLAVAIDLKKKMGLDSTTESSERQLCIFMETTNTLIGLMVDDVHEMFNVGISDFVNSPVNLGEQVDELVSGVYKLPNGLLHVINLAGLLKTNERKNFVH